MALWGKGDPRWIVEERPDSTNVNNWHWTERDATNWSKQKLKELFLKLKEETEEGSWEVDEVKTLDGEATINNRKGKLIFFYEWNVKLNYKGTLTGSESEHKGTIQIPNLSDENSADDLDIEVCAKGDSKNADKLKQLVRKNGIKMCRDKCQKYLDGLKEEYTTGMVLPTKEKINNTNNINSSKAVSKQFKVQEDMKNLNVNDKKTKNIQEVSLNITEEFKTSLEELYVTLTQPERLSAFTRSNCISNPTKGGEFCIMDGNVTGTYIELVPNEKIVQKWRFKQWSEGLFSTVTIELQQKDNSTIVKLHQTGVPDYDKQRTEEGWRQRFFGPIKQVFGFGANLF